MDFIQNHIASMFESGVEWVEIGYRNGSFKKMSGTGETALLNDNFLSVICNQKNKSRLCVIAHPHNISTEDVDSLSSHGIGMLRICINKKNINHGLILIKHAKESGLATCVNITRVSEIEPRQIVEFCEKVNKSSFADVIYLADSNGGLSPDRTSRLVHLLKTMTDLLVGFHAHDNLGLAMANSISAYHAGADYIDSSLIGMGKGSGNLRLESWIHYLVKDNGNHRKYNLQKIIAAVDMLTKEESQSTPEFSITDLILGSCNISIDKKKFLDRCNSNIETQLHAALSLKGQSDD